MDNIVTTLSHLKNTTTTNAGAINDVLLLVEDLLVLHNDSSLFPLPTSCQDIKKKHPNTPSGMYLIVTPDGETQHVYCHMEELCSSVGGWTRIAYLDMSDSTEECPPGFRLYQSGGIRACGKQSLSASCQSVKFSSKGISYSQLCGRVVGYQYGTTDAMYAGVHQFEEPYGSKLAPERFNINSYYVDGISLTRGSPRQHIWTFMAGLVEASFYSDGRYNCPCSQGSLQNSTIPSFIGNDYFCESGNPSTNGVIDFSTLYTVDPLWDGKGCGSLEQTCCQAPGLPWFHKVLKSTTTDYLEMRDCGDQDDEAVPVNYYEIYIK